jgi:hypothetical protein
MQQHQFHMNTMVSAHTTTLIQELQEISTEKNCMNHQWSANPKFPDKVKSPLSSDDPKKRLAIHPALLHLLQQPKREEEIDFCRLPPFILPTPSTTFFFPARRFFRDADFFDTANLFDRD